MENLQEELAFAYKQINGIDLPIKFPTPGDKYSDEKKLEQLRQVPFSLIKEVLTTIYKTDYQLFGYEIPDKPFWRNFKPSKDSSTKSKNIKQILANNFATLPKECCLKTWPMSKNRHSESLWFHKTIFVSIRALKNYTEEERKVVIEQNEGIVQSASHYVST